MDLSKIAKIKESLNETIKHCPNVLQENSCIGRVCNRQVNYRGLYELEPKNDVHYRDMSAIKCPLHRGFVMRV